MTSRENYRTDCQSVLHESGKIFANFAFPVLRIKFKVNTPAELKHISADSTSAALEKTLRYRLLNEPLQAESICRDFLDVDANNQEALVTLMLALMGQFETEFTRALNEAKGLLARLEIPYEKLYYAGVVNGRWLRFPLTYMLNRHTSVCAKPCDVTKMSTRSVFGKIRCDLAVERVRPCP